MTQPSDPLTFNRQALDPARSVVIEACAGSGKTWLLVSRIIRLLLAGVKPSEILAITFTRKAAQEMEARLADWLRFMAESPEPELRQFLRERALDESEMAALLPVARNLYEQVLASEPGLTINTFHGWFLYLVKHAPLSAGMTASATLLDRTSTVLEEAWQLFAQDLQNAPNDPLRGHLEHLFSQYGLSGTRDLLFGFVHRRGEWWSFTQGHTDPVGFALERLRCELGVDAGKDLWAECFGCSALIDELREYAGLLGRNTGRDQVAANDLIDVLMADDRASCAEAVLKVLFTNEGTPRQRKQSKAQADRLGGAAEQRLLELHDRLCAHIGAVRDAVVEQQIYATQVAALQCGAALLARYQDLKSQRQLIDFTDVEWRAYQLVSHSDHAEYLQYKLDTRYRHILLDEFQDTNPVQWQVLRAWMEASAAAGRHPKVFLVGDPKQSIYRFRRAEARLFRMAAAFLQSEYGAVKLEQNVSRRNATPILDVVNRVFAAAEDFDDFFDHIAAAPGTPGVVRLNGLIAAAEDVADAPDALRNPLLEPFATVTVSPHERAAAALAKQLDSIVGRWMVEDGQGGSRPARFRDVMLLVRNRTHLRAYEEALKSAGIPYLSARHGGLLETTEVGDLVALLEFLITPFADLHLARVLRSPLFHATDEDLLALAVGGEGSWWSRLRRLCESGGVSAALVRACTLLRGWQRDTGRLPVHDLLDRIYHQGAVMERYERTVPPSLRASVSANLRAFIALALDLDSGRYPSLPKFISEMAAFRQASAEEAPDEGVAGDVGDAVRILTIHGSKGLEAPIVWMIDAHRKEPRASAYGALIDWPPEEARPAHFSLFTRVQERGRQRDIFFEKEQTHAAREDLNLLYVAMTRARQALIIGGIGDETATDTWYARIRVALEGLGAVAAEDQALRWGELSVSSIADQTQPDAGESALPATTLPPALPAIIAVGERKVPPDAARRRGIMLHAILEWSIPPAQADDAAVLARRLGVSGEEFASLWIEAQALVRSAPLARFFVPENYVCAYNEAPVALANGELRRLDRIVEFDKEVWILDYKVADRVDETNASAHARVYEAQMREYYRAVQALYPEKQVRCGIVFAKGWFVELNPQVVKTV